MGDPMAVYYWVSLVATLLFTAILAVVGGYVKNTRDDLKDVRQELDDLQDAHGALKVTVAGEYMRKGDLRELHAELKADMKEYIELFREDLRNHIARIEAQVNK
ncbi:hypothetical protein [Paraburkholderia sp. BL10I2N1]|uniref:hypothetical protein n=1 Tax=Paraburkholderia sp. BL10I2N1 TaxID=1938796 RepID=UPI0010608B23|nr:hypothetical protein [Paraburkholderia sp. BL10I2N1]TDN70404.1 hypothetical protein B0G77_3877 [Paraburkholderia sp. BL10I2N1]